MIRGSQVLKTFYPYREQRSFLHSRVLISGSYTVDSILSETVLPNLLLAAEEGEYSLCKLPIGVALARVNKVALFIKPLSLSVRGPDNVLSFSSEVPKLLLSMSWRQAGTASNASLQKGNRLKEVKLDPLEAIGLPSKGDNRLLEFQTQEEYYTKVVDRYKALQHANRSADDAALDAALASLSIPDNPTVFFSAAAENPQWIVTETNLTAVKHTDARELATLIAAMRKLREAIVASARVDDFALSVYIFVIHATILVGQMESYHPALLHLLRNVLPAHHHHAAGKSTGLVPQEATFLGYYILDLACRQDDLGRAYHVACTYGYKDRTVNTLLRAIVRGDWCLYWRQREKMDRYQRRLCQWRDEKMAAHALDCLGASYLTVQREYVEEVARQKWTADGLGKLKPGWELEGSSIVIKRIRKR